MSLFLNNSEQDIIVFHVMKSLAYSRRIMISLGLIGLGFLLQILIYPAIWPVIFVFAGNLFLLVKGYDNRVEFGKFIPDSNWEKCDETKLIELERFHQKMEAWDRSALDITNPLGLTVLIVIIVVLIIFAVVDKILQIHIFPVIVANTVALLLPHWITGTRNILHKPKLMLKIQAVRKLIDSFRSQLKENGHEIDYYLLLEGAQTRVPADCKFRVNIKGQHPDFLGFYGQVVLNTVKGNHYTYFYVVLVAKEGYGLQKAHKDYVQPFPKPKIIEEYTRQTDVEVFVLRQDTTASGSGYYTNEKAIRAIFQEGLRLAEKYAPGPVS